MLEIIPLILSFVIAYVGISELGFGLYLTISWLKGTSPWDEVEVRSNVSYQLTQKFLPLMNLAVWVAAAWFYFSYADVSYANALLLGLVWLVVAVAVDYIGFVLTKHPLSVGHKGFYVGQYPWIYFTYAAVFVSPLLYMWLLG